MLRVVRLIVVLVGLAASAWAYGPFNHLCVVDRNWDEIYKQIQAVGPLAESNAVDAVFAGAIADDLGYYPLNSSLKDLTNQVHYIRTGEWVDFLLRRARDGHSSNPAVDYAFALGIMSHYAVDRMGHYYGTNVVAVALAHRENIFGPRMSYERDPWTHKWVEAGFDELSLLADCQAEKLSDRFYAFLQEGGWADSEQVFGFLVSAMRQFYGANPVAKSVDLVQAILFARRYVKALLKNSDAGPYAESRMARIQAPASPRAGSYTPTQGDIAKQDAWIKQQIELGEKFRSDSRSSDYLRIFGGSFAKAQELLLSTLATTAQLRARQDSELKAGQSIELENGTFVNVNLDTNQVSGSGRYDYADCTAKALIDNNSAAKLSYPATSGELAPYFAIGGKVRATMDVIASVDDRTLHAQLKKVADGLTQEHDLTQNALLSNSWSSVTFVSQKFPAAGCPSGSSVVVFGKHENICVGHGVVYWQGKVRAVSLLFAAEKSVSGGSDRGIEDLREVVESFRLCDGNKAGGFLDANSCKDGEPKNSGIAPSTACVNQD